MTYLSKDIRDHLISSTAIVNAFSDNIYADFIPQSERPQYAIVINDLSNDPTYDLGGEVGLHTSHVQIDIWTDGTGQKNKANELGELVRNMLSGYRGQFGDGVYGTSRMIRNNTVTSPPVDGSDQHRWRVSMDFEVIHSADVPTFT